MIEIEVADQRIVLVSPQPFPIIQKTVGQALVGMGDRFAVGAEPSGEFRHGTVFTRIGNGAGK